MVHKDTLADVLSEFARTLSTDFPIQGILDRLVRQMVDVLPVTSVGVTLINADLVPRYVAASDDAALRFEKLQTTIRQGPCLAAYDSGEAVSIEDLDRDRRFSLFSPAAAEAGLRAVFAFPLRQGRGRRLGALDLYRDAPGALDRAAMDAAQTMADVTAAYLLNAEARDQARASNERFRYMSLHDALTGLPNRALLLERLLHSAERAVRSRTSAAVLFVDLDRFKQVNDAHGHLVGDALLQEVATRLSGLVRPGDTLARVSGDEFVFLCEDMESPTDIEGLAQRIGTAFARPFIIDGLELTVTASVGIAFAGPGERVTADLLDQADTAMYQAKRQGGGAHQLLDLREALTASERGVMERDIRSAFVHEDLDIAYQPVVRTADRLITGVEALLRWTDLGGRGTVAPTSMVAIAEESGLINDIGSWVLEQSCLARGQWLSDHPRTPLDLSVNISPRQLLNKDFTDIVEGVLTKTGMDPTALILEMTENIFIEDGRRVRGVLDHLKHLGIRLAVDDFGTGYSSLSYLRRLPIDIVKIDRSFVVELGQGDPSAAALVEAVISLAHVLGLSVCAEGVETQAQHEDITRVHCDTAQGYLYARPMPAVAIGGLLGQQ